MRIIVEVKEQKDRFDRGMGKYSWYIRDEDNNQEYANFDGLTRSECRNEVTQAVRRLLEGEIPGD